MTKRYYAVWFARDERSLDRTARIIVDTERYPIGKTSLAEYSRLFPTYEARRMKCFFRGDTYATWKEAFVAAVAACRID